MPELEPITREEKLLDGQDLEPITRKEMFIKRIYNKTQVVPKPITREEMFLNKAGEGGGGDITVEQLNVTENGTYSESGKAYSPVVVNVPTPPVPENAYLLNDLSDLPADIASFNDGTDLPMASLKVAVTPYQDLHGYDAPWAGGAGKNKLDYDTVYTNYKQSDGSFRLTGNNVNSISIPITSDLVGQQLTFSVYLDMTGSSTPTSTVAIAIVDGQTKYGNTINAGASGRSSITFTPTSTSDSFKITFGSNGGNYFVMRNLQLEKGTLSDFAPYSNICPIIGWDEAVVTRCGKNLFDKVNCGVYNGYISNKIINSPSHKIVYIPCKPNTTYSCSNFSGNERQDITYSSELPYKNLEVPYPQSTITTDANAKYLLCYCYNATRDTVTFDDVKNAFDIELGSVAPTSYLPYNGATYTIDLNGTRYGGTLDATDGTFLDMIDHIASYNGEELPPAWISDRDVYAVGTTPTIGAEVVYTRATPITVQLSPTQVKSLEGKNNIFANCGDIIKLEYFSKEV